MYQENEFLDYGVCLIPAVSSRLKPAAGEYACSPSHFPSERAAERTYDDNWVTHAPAHELYRHSHPPAICTVPLPFYLPAPR